MTAGASPNGESFSECPSEAVGLVKGVAQKRLGATTMHGLGRRGAPLFSTSGQRYAALKTHNAFIGVCRCKIRYHQVRWTHSNNRFASCQIVLNAYTQSPV